MLKWTVVLSGAALVAVTLALAGCNKSDDSAPPAAPSPAGGAAQHDHADHEGHGEQANHEEPSEHADNLAELSDADRALVAKQKVCPVSGESLGAMGKPHKVTVEGRDVFLCCPNCAKKFAKDPAKYLAKLPQ